LNVSFSTSTLLSGLPLAVVAAILTARPAFSGESDSYRYLLVHGKDAAVCRHMHNVYSEKFVFPWKRPTLDLAGKNYGQESNYAFPKLPGVTHEPRAALEMSYSRHPTSPEFEAIKWQEGRYRFIEPSGKDHGELPMLIAEFDIDNDGKIETVIKARFMETYYIHRGSGGEDALFVFPKGEVDLSKAIASEILYRPNANDKRPVMISMLPSAPFRLVRPFVVEGVTYLSAYRQEWSEADKIKKESIHILLFHGASKNPEPLDRRNNLLLEPVCELRMIAMKQPSGKRQ